MKPLVIIAMKGSPSKAKRKLAISVAEKLRCPLMDPDDFIPALEQCLASRLEVPENLINYYFEKAVLLMAQVQLQLKLSVVVNSPLSNQRHFYRLVNLAASNDTTLLLIDCREDEYSLQDYDVGHVNMLILVLNADEVGKEVVSKVLQFIASCSDLIVDSRSTGKEVEEEKDEEEVEERGFFFAKFLSHWILLSKVLMRQIYLFCNKILSFQKEVEEEKNNSEDADDIKILSFQKEVEEKDQEEKKNNWEDSDEKLLKDFAHSDHPLVFCDEGDKNNHNGVTCKACLKPIWGPIYSCVDCQFFLHKSCAELPFKIQSPVDNVPGPLFLSLTRAPLSKCLACGDGSGNCLYWSTSVGLSMDPKCSKLATKIEREFHQHPLYLEFGRYADFDYFCDACGNICERIHYSCYECNLDLHIQCAFLPITIKHKCHCDPFTLTTSSPLDDSDEYYCDECEERREAEHWFYYCSECNYAAHLSCIIPEIIPYPSSQRELNYRSTCESHRGKSS